MAGIKVTPEEFIDIVIALLLDAMTNEDEVQPDNIEFHYILDKMKGAGIKAQLISYYLDTSSITRGKYKSVKGSFTGKSARNSIVITKSRDDDERDDKTTIKNIVKKTLSIIKSHKLRRNNGMPLNEKTVDRIIDKVLTEYKGE